MNAAPEKEPEMTATIRIVGYQSSEDQDIKCATCGRLVKYAAGMSDRDGLHGLDCTAKILGRPRSRSSLNDIEIEAIIAQRVIGGAEIGRRLRAEHGALPSRRVDMARHYDLLKSFLWSMRLDPTTASAASEAWGA